MAFYHALKDYEASGEAEGYPGKHSWIASRLLTLRRDLFHAIEKDRSPHSLTIGFMNIRAFDDGVPRLDESYHYLAEIIDHFDVCAIAEVKTDLAPLKRLVRLMGPNWDYFVSDVSTHEGGNNERFAFVFDTSKVMFRNLVGEIVISNDELIDGNQIARSPFFASFQAGWFKFCLCSAHIIFGDDLALRAKEVEAITNAIVKRAKKEDQVYILLGDLNAEERDGSVTEALRKSKMTLPDFGPTNMGGDRWYDRIALTTKGKAQRKTRLLRHGVFDWRHSVFGPHPTDTPEALTDEEKSAGLWRPTLAENLDHYEGIVEAIRAEYGKRPYSNWSKSYKSWTTFEMSDHLPIWIELEVDYSDDYLSRFL